MINRLNIRQACEERESGLSPYAARSAESRGHQRAEEPCPIRTAFQRDRDRIIHCKAFRRLKHKTQVFIAPLGDHFVTRLTHTLEVSQLARTIARALSLNEDLTEAISLGHDLGHTPFGHIGEDVLNELYSGGFRHNEQSLRVVEVLEKNGQGLNLTWETRDGILNHSKPEDGIFGRGWSSAGTFEGDIIKIADIIAYVNHDIEDSIRAGVLKENDLPESAVNILGRGHSRRINTMVCDIVESSWGLSGKIPADNPAIRMSQPVLEATNTLRLFLFERVYKPRSAGKEAEKAREIVRKLFAYFTYHPERLPEEYLREGDSTERSVVDYIAGMTDQFAARLAENLG
jgi:dGTPase